MTPTRRMAVLSIATSLATLALKFAAYALTGSIGVLSDALEALVNLAASLVAFGALTIAERPADAGHAWGHDKAEYFASGTEGALVLVAALGILYAGLGRLLQPPALTHLGPGVTVAALAALLNLLCARRMLHVAGAHDSITIEADARHLLADVWTSAAVIAGLLLVWAAPRWAIVDPLIAIAVGLHVGVTGVSLLRRSAAGLMDSSLPASELAELNAVLAATLPAGASVTALRTRKAGRRRFVEFILRVPGVQTVDESHATCDRLEARLAAALENATVTIHVEPATPDAAH